jgi:hypothetical protein
LTSPFLERRVPQLLDEVVDLYRADGRPLASLTDENLDARFIDAVERYIEDPRTPSRFRNVNSVAAEFVLRKRDAPIATVVRLKLTAPKDTPPKLRPMLAMYEAHRPKLAVVISVEPDEGQRLPWVVLSFGSFAVVPGLGAILRPEAADRKVHRPDSKEAEAAMQREFNWLIGLPAT